MSTVAGAVHDPKHKISRGIFENERCLLFANMLQSVTKSFLMDGLRKVAENQVESLRLSPSSKHGEKLLQQYFCVGLERVKNWNKEELRDEEERVLSMFPDLVDLYKYSALTLAQTLVKDVGTEVQLELPSFQEFLFVFYQTLVVQPYVVSLRYFDSWYLETAALIQDITRYSLYTVVKDNIRLPDAGARSLRTEDVVDFKQDPVQALEKLGLPDEPQPLDSVSQVGREPEFFDPEVVTDRGSRTTRDGRESRVSAASLPSRLSRVSSVPPLSGVSSSSRASSRHTHDTRTERSSRVSVSHEPHNTQDTGSRHSTRSSRAPSMSSLKLDTGRRERDDEQERRSMASRRSILEDARSILSKARSRARESDHHHDRHSRQDSRQDSSSQSRVASHISLNLSDIQLMPRDTRSSRASRRSRREPRLYDSESSESDRSGDSGRRSRSRSPIH